VVVTAAILVACTGSDRTGPSSTTITTQPPTTVLARANVNGQLKIGVLLPSSGTGETIGEPMIRAVSLAVDDINNAGGVFGRDVLYMTQDEGSTSLSAAKALDELIKANVDAIVGPASSRIAPSLIERIKQNRVLTCSPTATAIALSAPSDDGYFIRTIPSDALQARLLAKQIIATGLRSTTIVYPDDDYGASFASSLRQELETFSVGVTVHPYDPLNPTDVAAVAVLTANEKPDTVAVLGDQSAAVMIAALKNLQVGSPGTPIFVDDATRHPDVSASSSIPSAVMEGVTGVSPLVDPDPGPSDEADADWYRKEFLASATPNTPIAFSAYAYDCTTLIALAASIAGTDDGARMRQPAIDASKLGQFCHNYVDCSELLGDKRDIDLNGASGEIDLDANGDPQVGQFDVFQIQGGRDVTARTQRAP
jgi:branched-chain amino acid transport system substrate-binding protein